MKKEERERKSWMATLIWYFDHLIEPTYILCVYENHTVHTAQRINT